MSYIDFWTLCIPYMNDNSICSFASTSKLYHDMFTKNKELWLQVIAMTLKIPTYTNNLTDNTNLLHYYIDLRYISTELDTYLNNIDTYDDGKASQLGHIYDRILPIITTKKDNIMEYISTIGSIKDIFESLIDANVIGLLSTILSLKNIILSGEMLLDILRTMNDHKINTIKFLYQDTDRLELINQYINISLEQVDGYDLLADLLTLPYDLFVKFISKINPSNISYFFIRDILYNAIKDKTEKISDPLAKIAYVAIHLNRYNHIIKDVYKYFKSNENVDIFFYYLFILQLPDINDEKILIMLVKMKCVKSLYMLLPYMNPITKGRLKHKYNVASEEIELFVNTYII